MSQAHPSKPHDPHAAGATHVGGHGDDFQVHEGPIKTPKQLMWAVLAGFLIPIALAVMLANFVSSGKRPAAGSDGLEAKAIAQRIKPVGHVDVKDASDMSTLKSGAEVYAAQCAACHANAVAGAPKFADAAAWAPRIKTGLDMLVQSSLKGKGSMGAQGGGDFNDIEITRAVVHMANQAGAKFVEPKVPTAAAAAPVATAAAPAPAPAPALAPAAVSAAAPAAAAVVAAVAAAPAKAAAVAAPVAAAAAVAAKADEPPALYTQMCGACHAQGVANAPKLADKAAWAPRMALGIDGLTASVIKGKGAMPARGGAAAASDAEIKAAVAYMVGTVK
jgi:cytochrome c5